MSSMSGAVGKDCEMLNLFYENSEYLKMDLYVKYMFLNNFQMHAIF